MYNILSSVIKQQIGYFAIFLLQNNARFFAYFFAKVIKNPIFCWTSLSKRDNIHSRLF